MSNARAEGYDTPAQQRQDSATFTPALPSPTHLDDLVEPDWQTVRILCLLLQCLCSIGAQGDTLTHPDNEVALGLRFLDAAEQGNVDGSIAFVPGARYPALRTAASRARSRLQHPPQSAAAIASAIEQFCGRYPSPSPSRC